MVFVLDFRGGRPFRRKIFRFWMVKVPEKFGLEKKTKPVPEKVTVSVPVKFDTSTGKFPGIWYRYRRIPGNFPLFGWYR